MLVHYLKQAWLLMRQNKLFSVIYVIGTALAISMVMVVALFFYLKTGNIYPETERGRCLYMNMALIAAKDTTQRITNSSGLSRKTVKECFYTLRSAEAVTAVMGVYNEKNVIGLPESAVKREVSVKYIDAAFWNVYQFRFLQGKPFSEEEFESGIRSAVISDVVARYLFPDGQAEGKRFLMNKEEYRVSGVVRDPSYLLPSSFAHAWVPYTVHKKHNDTFAKEDILGMYQVVMLVAHDSDFRAVREEVNANILRYSDGLTQNINLLGQPDTVLANSFRLGNRPLDMNSILLKYAALILVFLLVPALNLSGLNSGRMEKRLAELGVRKAFGAPNNTLLGQVLAENFLLTLFGGLAGLLLSYLLILLSGGLLLSLADTTGAWPASSGVTPSMLLNIPVFIGALLASLAINILSAIVPAYRFTRRSITDSLKGIND